MARLTEVFGAYGRSCVYCGGIATTRDHLVPRSRGGPNRLSNLRPACRRCNHAKGDRTPLEWLGDRCPAELRAVTALHRVCPRCFYRHFAPRSVCKNCGARMTSESV